MTAWPTMEQVEAADAEALLRWTRFLPGATSDERLEIINRIFTRLGEERRRLDEEEPGEWVRISKRVGLG